MARRKSLALIAVVYLLGLFIGALDTGIVTPARTVIQSDLNVNDAYGVWLITIYTLAYAASIPVMGKFADKWGRKWIYLISVSLFGIGSLMCGLAQTVGSFEFLLVSRAIQALGGGGIMPIATAEFGTAFPPEKRGMALGLVGGVYGIANVFGASAGSLVLDIFGQGNWQFIFYVNVPVALFVVIAGIYALPNTKESNVMPIDGPGIAVLTMTTLSLLYGLRNIDFFDLGNSIMHTDVYPFLIATALLIPVFILVENRATDPIINLAYFKNPSLVITFLLSIITGIVMMGMIFIPQYAENALHMPSGAGGYYVIILGLFAGIGAPVSGRLIDKLGVKAVLGFGFVASIAGSLYLAFVSVANPNTFNVVISLILLGLGMGFTMGTPLNYMMLQHTDEHESNSALATLSLIRSIGTAIAPAIMVGFITHGVAGLQTQITAELPTQVTISALPHAHDLQDEIDKLKKDKQTKDMVKDMKFPDLSDMEVIEIDMSEDTAEDSKYEVPEYLIDKMKDSDVTTITATTKEFVSVMFDEVSPDQIKTVDDGINSGIKGVNSGRKKLDNSIAKMANSINEMDDGIAQMDSALASQTTARQQMADMIPTLDKYTNYDSVLDFVPASAQQSMPDNVKKTLAKVKTASDLRAQMKKLSDAQTKLEKQQAQMKKGRAGIQAGLKQAKDQKADLEKQLAADKKALATATDPATIGPLTGKIAGEEAAIKGVQQGITKMESQISQMDQGIKGLDQAISAQKSAYSQMAQMLPQLQKLENYNSVLDLMPESALAALPDSARETLAKVRTVGDLQAQIGELDSAMAKMTESRSKMAQASAEMKDALSQMKASRKDMTTMASWMKEMKAAVPDSFEEAKQNYLAEVEKRSDQIETIFQKALNEGFRGIFLLVAIASGIGLVLLMFYRTEGKIPTAAEVHAEEAAAEEAAVKAARAAAKGDTAPALHDPESNTVFG